jgi:halocyanin-like protein
MTNQHETTRRTALKLAATAAFPVGLAGCSGSSGGGSGGSGDGGSDGSGGEGGGTATPTASASSGDGGTPEFGGWFDGVENYDGVVDETGRDEVTVTVGTEANGGNFGFGPAAVRVDPGTTVVWEWNGEGGSHNVVDDAGSFESEMTAEEGHTFSQTFDSPATSKYYCTPHQTLGMKGVVVVE